ncbi:ferredoxin [Silicimonas algicola]|nr:ferredoxin [Silicimonas algicola]
MADLESLAGEDNLTLLGACATRPDDGLGIGTLCLLGPSEPGFWAHFTKSNEYRDSRPDPMDRWSRRVVETLSEKVGGSALFPFGDPARPFIDWALRSGAHASPVTLLVHQVTGLWLSYRGAVLLPGLPPLEAATSSPCPTCAQPCRTACPADALTADGYDLGRCHAYLNTAPGADCMNRGCVVRRACPAGAGYLRSEAQSAFHMRAFHP